MIFSIPEGYYMTVAYILSGVLGLCVGSFLNVVIYRLPNHMNLAFPPSHCTTCDYQLRWYDNIPVLSYVILGGKCRKCKQKISIRYTVVEIANALFWLASCYCFHENVIYMIASMFTTSLFLCICFVDLEKMIIPDCFQLGLAVTGILMMLTDEDDVWYSHIVGLAFGFLVFLGVGFLVSRKVGREALGGGDIKLSAMLGLALGWRKYLLTVLIASVIGAIVMGIRAKKDGESKDTPFGPFLTGAGLIALFLGEWIIQSYLSLVYQM